jgi:Helix-turn-helix domain
MLLIVAEAQKAGALNAKALRALAHPLRWHLIDLIGSEETATATRCAQVLGESVASCSYHLGILAKYGFIEPVPGKPGKEKPWRLISTRQVLSAEGPDGEHALAAEAATEAFLDHELVRIKQRLRRLGLEPEPWRQASLLSGMTTWLTVGELRAASGDLARVLERHADRADNPALRPPDAREVRLFVMTSVAPPLPPPGTPPLEE